MQYEEWLAQVPEDLKQDPLWQFQVYPTDVLNHRYTLLDEIIAMLVSAESHQRRQSKR